MGTQIEFDLVTQEEIGLACKIHNIPAEVFCLYGSERLRGWWMVEADGKAQNGDQDSSPLDLRTKNELVLLYSLSPSTTAQLMAAV